jgi:mycofactocin precursor
MTPDRDKAAQVAASEADDEGDDDLVEEEVLVEMFSIDGMCGVY